MSRPTVLIGIGATKAGTSWLYRTLADRADCALPAVKELHYWDTFSPPVRQRQLAVFQAQLARFEVMREEAETAGRRWQARNMDRRIADMAGLIAMLDAPRKGHLAYLAYIRDRGTRTRLVADICPAYGLLSKAKLKDMVALGRETRLLYLVRDPLARLWSAVRMQAERQLFEGQSVPQKSNATLWRILHKGKETHITARGDYAATLARLAEAVPRDRYRVMVMEELMGDAGYDALCDWLDLPRAPAPVERKVHAGVEVEMREDLRDRALKELAPQYDAVAAHLGRVPAAWAANMKAL
ncbi:MAG: sulfotransferase family protein [Pseudomonadota bacterium]